MIKNGSNFNSINNKYLSRINDVVKNNVEIDIKHNIVDQIAEDYFKEVGETLPPLFTKILADWYLMDDFKSKLKNKASTQEYPVLSVSQIKRRKKPVILATGDTLDYYGHSRGKKTKKNTKELKE